MSPASKPPAAASSLSPAAELHPAAAAPETQHLSLTRQKTPSLIRPEPLQMLKKLKGKRKKVKSDVLLLTEAPSSSCSLETVARRSCSIRTDSWSPRRRALSSALSLLSCRFLLLRSRTSSRYLEFWRRRRNVTVCLASEVKGQSLSVLFLTSLCSLSSSSLLRSCSLSISSSFLLTEEQAGLFRMLLLSFTDHRIKCRVHQEPELLSNDTVF